LQAISLIPHIYTLDSPGVKYTIFPEGQLHYYSFLLYIYSSAAANQRAALSICPQSGKMSSTGQFAQD
jgi:hypothetical protein